MNAEEAAGQQGMSQGAATGVPQGDAGAGGADNPLAAVDRELARLNELDDLPVAEHVERFEAVHAVLADALSGVDRV